MRNTGKMLELKHQLGPDVDAAKTTRREEASGSHRICQLANGIGAAARAASGTNLSFQNGHHSSERVRVLTYHVITAVSDPFHFASRAPNVSENTGVCGGNQSSRCKRHLASSNSLALGSTPPSLFLDSEELDPERSWLKVASPIVFTVEYV
ncbi:unnamed protein product [Rangifer tarandus platyrhynchus]|uniref:Uncharacterized protein n=2 Tax=Rangifer tarandus platyrhynchus TaxID=3082113 RepID=A0ABN8ZL28_RANTA|nr:unnamed protein product [Rangifer tarandus platyrhynchus]CAI9708222.1 unnamed protein product [Rangifer tarandus platyrhynchus]